MARLLRRAKLEDDDVPVQSGGLAKALEASQQQRVAQQQATQVPGNRCTGGCCRAFFGITREGLSRKAAAGADDVAEREAILEMLIPIPGGQGATCVHYDDITGDCGAYAQRPAMCRDYPYGRSCDIPSCTWRTVSARHRPVVSTYPTRLRVYSECAPDAKLLEWTQVAERGDVERRKVQAERLVAAAVLRRSTFQ